MNQNLLNKYNIAVPRYTSYPPANYFEPNFSPQSYIKAVEESNTLQPQHISIYIHIPFCHRLCFYCGCNAMIMQQENIVKQYIEALKKEIKMLLPHIDKHRKISQIHYGGGSPTSQAVPILKEINDIILSNFETIENPEIAIECHPGYLDEAYWLGLVSAGFTRMSIGIQDFDEKVLKTSNRKPSLMPIEDIFTILRSKNIAINMDFIYGLPHQTKESFSQTIQKAIALKPDRVVTFSYAHVPWVNPLQMKLEEAGLPTLELKNSLYGEAKNLLVNAGYTTIGLDHFVLPSDELCTAKQTNELHRNFQGYCTRRTTGQVYAFGTTGISQLSGAYSQNTKNLNEYITRVNNDEFPVSKGYLLSNGQQITAKIIESLMCNYQIDWNQLSDSLGITVAKLKSHVNYDTKVLDEFVSDGIITYNDNYLKLSPNSNTFVRNVAASLDPLMLHTDKKFSKSV